MPKDYPGFIIDRSKRSPQSKYTDDYIVCTDTDVGFVAKIYRLSQSQIGAHNDRVRLMTPDEANVKFCSMTFGERAIVILEVVHLLHPPLALRSKMQSLMKKALKAYLHGEVRAVGGEGTNLDKQIAMVEHMREMHIAQRKRLEEIDEVSTVDYKIGILDGAVSSLETLKQILTFNGKAN